MKIKLGPRIPGISCSQWMTGGARPVWNCRAKSRLLLEAAAAAKQPKRRNLRMHPRLCFKFRGGGGLFFSRICTYSTSRILWIWWGITLPYQQWRDFKFKLATFAIRCCIGQTISQPLVDQCVGNFVHFWHGSRRKVFKINSAPSAEITDVWCNFWVRKSSTWITYINSA